MFVLAPQKIPPNQQEKKKGGGGAADAALHTLGKETGDLRSHYGKRDELFHRRRRHKSGGRKGMK